MSAVPPKLEIIDPTANDISQEQNALSVAVNAFRALRFCNKALYRTLHQQSEEAQWVLKRHGKSLLYSVGSKNEARLFQVLLPEQVNWKLPGKGDKAESTITVETMFTKWRKNYDNIMESLKQGLPVKQGDDCSDYSLGKQREHNQWILLKRLKYYERVREIKDNYTLCKKPPDGVTSGGNILLEDSFQLFVEDALANLVFAWLVVSQETNRIQYLLQQYGERKIYKRSSYENIDPCRTYRLYTTDKQEISLKYPNFSLEEYTTVEESYKKYCDSTLDLPRLPESPQDFLPVIKKQLSTYLMTAKQWENKCKWWGFSEQSAKIGSKVQKQFSVFMENNKAEIYYREMCLAYAEGSLQNVKLLLKKYGAHKKEIGSSEFSYSSTFLLPFGEPIHIVPSSSLVTVLARYNNELNRLSNASDDYVKKILDKLTQVEDDYIKTEKRIWDLTLVLHRLEEKQQVHFIRLDKKQQSTDTGKEQKKSDSLLDVKKRGES